MWCWFWVGYWAVLFILFLFVFENLHIFSLWGLWFHNSRGLWILWHWHDLPKSRAGLVSKRCLVFYCFQLGQLGVPTRNYEDKCLPNVSTDVYVYIYIYINYIKISSCCVLYSCPFSFVFLPNMSKRVFVFFDCILTSIIVPVYNL